MRIYKKILMLGFFCEQSLRSVVIDRKITQGTRSDWGNRWSERIWTVSATCKQRDENVMSFMRSSVGAFLQGFSPPVFLVEQSALPKMTLKNTQ